MSLVNLTMEGFLSKDAETRFTTNGKAIVAFSMAHNQGKKEDNKPPIWMNFKAVGEAATIVDGALKGAKCKVVRSIPEEWTDKNDNKRLTWVVFECEFLRSSREKELPPVDDNCPF